MKVRSIPAQITTVEDKIAGNLNLTQILLLMIPVFWLMIVYTLFTPTMHFALYKIPLFLIVGVTSLILSIRIKEKIILNWLTILLRYNTRAKYYLFDKNDSYMRAMDLITFEGSKKKQPAKSTSKKTERTDNTAIALGDLVKLERLLIDPKYSFSIKSQKKGSLYVAFEQNQK